MPSLALEDIRSAAKAASLTEIQFNCTSRVIAFKPRNDDDVRINVYYTTGTVSTFLDHPRQGRSQLFRRNVSLPLLREIFTNPRVHTPLGYHFKNTGNKRIRSRSQHRDNFIDSSSNTDWEPVLDEESAAKNQLEVLLKEKDAIDQEISGRMLLLAEAIRKAEEERRRRAEAEEAERQQKENERDKRGRRAVWSGLRESKSVKQNFTPDTTCVAIGGNDCDTTLFLKEGGEYCYCSGLTIGLYNLLHTRPLHAPPPTYVALGSQNRYYVEFAQGKSRWVGPEQLSDELYETNRSIASIAFGESYESWFIVYTDGWFACNDIPDGLNKLVKSRNCRPDLKCVSLGPSGEWYLAARNGRAWWNGLSDAGFQAASKKQESITGLWFEENYSYFIRHT